VKGCSTGRAGHPKQIDVTARGQQEQGWAHQYMVPHFSSHREKILNVSLAA
jgi:hypothetical protein